MMTRREQPAMRRILAEFEKRKPLTKYDLSERCHLHFRNVLHYLKILKSDKSIHIHSYARAETSGNFTARWIIGDGEDAQKPERISCAERRRRWRERPENREVEAAKKRAKRQAQKLGFSIASIKTNIAR